MNRLIIYVIFLIFSFQFASAKEDSKINLIFSPLQLGYRYAKQMDTQMVWQNANSFAVGGQYQRHIFLLDYGQFSDSSGNQMLSYRKDRTEWLLSYRYAVYSLAAHLNLGMGFGLGVYDDMVKSRLGTQEVSESTGAQVLASGLVSLGGNWNYFFYAAELQMLQGKDYDPQPTLGGLLRIGIQFAIF